MHIRGKLHSRILEGGNIQRLTQAVIPKEAGTQQLIRARIRNNAALVYQYYTVHIPMQHVLYAVLDYYYGGFRALVYIVDKLYGRLACGGVKVCKGLVKEQHRYVIHQHSRKGHPLLLPAGKLVRGVGKHIQHINFLCCLLHPLQHCLVGCAVVFHGKGYVLCHRKPHKLGIRILQYGADGFGYFKQRHILCLFAVYLKAAGYLADVGKGN